MRRLTLLLGAASLAACGQASDQSAGNATAAAPKKKIPYCFFKDPDTKGWRASTDAQGNVVVKGKAYRSDGRYMAVLGAPVITGASAEVRPTVVPNDTGFSAPGDWWDMSFTIPGSAAVDTVEVRCGKKLLAELTIKRKP